MELHLVLNAARVPPEKQTADKLSIAFTAAPPENRLLSSSDGSRKKPLLDQMSVSSSGSSSSEMDDYSFTLRPKSQSGLCLNISADASGSCPDPNCSSPTSSSSQSDVSTLSSDGASPSPSPSPSSSSSSSSQAVYNKQSDSCIIRVSMALHSCNIYKSILANLYYAMCPSDSYDFVLRPRWRTHSLCSSPAVLRRAHK
ncbi:hypothetical protein C0J45_8952 [Silurus meridionalis]|nr:hypothetical protein C0J45_8952 [Silurus meridionalis]